MKEFFELIRQIYPLSEEAERLLTDYLEEVTLPKGYLLIEAGKVAPYSWFVVKGFARGYFLKEEKDMTIWFAGPGMSLLSMNSYMFGSGGYENIELMEECELLKISNRDLQGLFERNIELANLGRLMSDHVIIKMEQLFMERNFLPAAKRYELLIKRTPEILQKVPLRHIASYLGITQVSLSRIRAGVQ